MSETTEAEGRPVSLGFLLANQAIDRSFPQLSAHGPGAGCGMMWV